MKLKLTAPACALALACGLSGCNSDQQAATSSSHHILAEVDDLPVTSESFRHWWERQKPSTDTAETRTAVLDDLIHRHTLVQQARAAGLHNDPDVREAINSLLIAKLKEVELQPALAAAQVAEKEARAVYEAEKDTRYTEPASVRAAVLWFETRGQAPLAQRYQQRLQKVCSLLSEDPAAAPAGEGFGQMAIANSEHRGTRFKGGDLGWLRPGTENDKVRAATAEIVQNLDLPGQLSEVVVREEGVFLVRLIDRRKARTKSFEQVRSQIKQKLLAGKRRIIEQQFEQRMCGGTVVTRHQDRLDNLQDLPIADPEPDSPFSPSLSQVSTHN